MEMKQVAWALQGTESLHPSLYLQPRKIWGNLAEVS